VVFDLHTPAGWKTELTWVIGYISRWFTCCRRSPIQVGYNPAVHVRESELTTCWSRVRRPNHYTTKPPTGWNTS